MNIKELKHLENKIHTEIPMTKLMKLNLDSISEKHLTTHAPLDININDKGSAFGGSLSSIAIISSWCLVRLVCDELEIDDCDILVIKNESSFKRQVSKDIFCECLLPTNEDKKILLEKYQVKDSASIKVEATIKEDNEICMTYSGIYVVKKKR